MPDRTDADGHDCTDHAVWDFGDYSHDHGNKPPTGTVPGECDECGADLTLDLEVTGVRVEGEPEGLLAS